MTIITVLVTLFIFGVLIFIHELGHYIAARACGVGVREFAIGMGPKLISWKGKHNLFSLRALPIGGFVSMVGEAPGDEKTEADVGKKGLNEKPLWQRIAVTAAGPLMNLLLGLVIMTVIVSCSSLLPTTVVADFTDNSSSNQSGLMINDKIIKVDGQKVNVYNDLAYLVALRGTKPIGVTVIRNGEEIELTGVVFSATTEKGIAFGSIDFYIYGTEKTFGNVVHESFFRSISTVKMTIESLFATIRGDYGWEAISGPIGIGEEIGSVINESNGFAETVAYLANMMVLISVSLGIFNLLPIPVLDGGHLLFYIIEAIRRKPLDQKVENAINAFFMVILFGFMIFVVFKDIFNLI